MRPRSFIKKRIVPYGLAGLIVLFILSYQSFLRDAIELARLPEPREAIPFDGNPPTFIAHAGGSVSGINLSNSLEALDTNYSKGARFFEIDFSLTSDGRFVATHDWNSINENYFSLPPGAVSSSEFLDLKIAGKLTTLSLDTCLEWLKNHPDAYLVTDFKQENFAGLKKISAYGNDLMKRVVPQVYSFSEFPSVRGLGFPHVILTLYRKNYSPRAVHKFAKQFHPFAITMPLNRADELFLKDLAADGIPSYAHTINDLSLARELTRKGLSGVYTDSLLFETL